MTLNLWAIIPLGILAWIAASFLFGSGFGRAVTEAKPQRPDWRSLLYRTLLPR